MATLAKDPDAVLDYAIDWSTWLGTDTIATSEWSVPDGITVDSHSNTTTTATVWLSGGTAGDTYDVTNTVGTAEGRTIEQSFQITCRESTTAAPAETTTAAAIVAAIDMALVGTLEAGGVKDYMIGSRRITRYSATELIQLRGHYAALAAATTRGGNVTYVGFRNPGGL